MNGFTGIIQAATRGVERSYFHLDIDGGDAVYRERVYCYELYHQMRLLWPEDTPFYLNGEIDKAAHPILRTLGADYAKPDLLVHQPGYMHGNYAIIEVKSSKATPGGIQKDLKTLSLFINRVKYQRAIYLIYGNQARDVATKALNIHISAKLRQLAPTELWIHEKAGQAATHFFSLLGAGQPSPAESD